MKLTTRSHMTRRGIIKKNPQRILYHGSNHKFDRFSLDGIMLDSTDQAGTGIYLTNNKIDAMMYGKYIYVINLQPGKVVPIIGQMKISDIMFMINNAPDKETALSNYAEYQQDAIREFIKLNKRQEKQPFEYFQTLWYEFYRYEPKEFIKNMQRLCYSYVKIKVTNSINHYVVYDPNKIIILNRLERK